jgi:hypothetical protein
VCCPFSLLPSAFSLVTAERTYSRPGSGTDKARQIFRARLFAISVWRGIASNSAGGRVDPERMRPAFSLEVAAVGPKVLQPAASFHLTITVSCSASGGTPRKPSSRRSARIRAIASTVLTRVPSRVCLPFLRRVGTPPNPRRPAVNHEHRERLSICFWSGRDETRRSALGARRSEEHPAHSRAVVIDELFRTPSAERPK